MIATEKKYTKKILAAKIILEQNLNVSVNKIWPLLKHNSVIPVVNCYYLPQPHTWAFLMPKHRASLSNVIETEMLHTQEKIIERVLSWLEGALNGLSYLRQRNLCHLDVKPDSILTDDSDSTLITDFESLTHTERGVNTYTAPLIYCPSETMRLENEQKTIVDAFKFDSYTIGVLAIEMVTKHQVIRGAAANGDRNPNWMNVMYPIIFNILKGENYKKCMKCSFLNSGVSSETIRNMRNFTAACISFNPENRPTVETALRSKLFGGSAEFEKKENGVW